MACKPIITSPRTESQLRSVLSRILQCAESTEIDFDELEARLVTTGTAGGTIAAGDVVYASSDGGISRAQADASTTAKVAGIALTAATVGLDITYQSVGVVPGLSGLTFNTYYYLSAAAAGALTATAPSTAGQYVVPVGYALTATQLLLVPWPRILL